MHYDCIIVSETHPAPMFTDFRSIVALVSAVALAPTLSAHESFLPMHAFHLHQKETHAHDPADGKSAQDHAHAHDGEASSRFQVATGARYTRLSLNGERADLWESTVGVEFSVTSWLHLGGELSYGWFNSDEGGADGLMVPHAHADLHFPLGGSWEVLAGFDVGFPGGDEALVGDHWEFTPSVELRYDQHTWFGAVGTSFAFTEGDDQHDHEHEHDEAGDEHDEHSHDEHGEADFHEIVDPHGSRELHYFAAFGVRVLDESLELESRLSGIHVTSGDTEDRNYVRAGLRAAWKIDDRWTVSAQASLPITEARRNEWQASLAVRVGF